MMPDPGYQREILLAITDSEVIVTTWFMNLNVVSIFNIDGTLPIDVLAWINLLKRDDGGVGTR